MLIHAAGCVVRFDMLPVRVSQYAVLRLVYFWIEGSWGSVDRSYCFFIIVDLTKFIRTFKAALTEMSPQTLHESYISSPSFTVTFRIKASWWNPLPLLLFEMISVLIKLALLLCLWRYRFIPSWMIATIRSNQIVAVPILDESQLERMISVFLRMSQD